MVRPLRITYPGAIYHIINRGCRRDKIFRRIADREEFLSRLTAASSKYGIIIHGYCLMDNHFHLLVETPNENLSAFMQLLQCGYANWFKVRYKLVGPLFQSRFKSVLVEDESYLVTLSAYIHLNPVRAKMTNDPESYRWSSCGQYLRNERTELVDPAMVMEYAGGVDNYTFILEEMIEDSLPPEAVYGKFSILGTAAFKEKVARQIDDTEISRKGVSEYKKLKSTTPEKIAEAVKKVMNVSDEQMIAKTKGNTARKLFLYLLKKHTTLKVVEIAELSGMSSVAAGELIRRFGREMKASKELATLLNHSEKLLNE
ncbi:MAG TPA: transposase [bacterium]|jgi:REP element-mobilizing transposase RayT|nr:transposase [bacterium]HNZ54980.1 transposase [bacterium]HPY16019.1 transposase [bacterium]HQB10727.1 transposase [bacterium]HQM86198.1 transposase [bacterium]